MEQPSKLFPTFQLIYPNFFYLSDTGQKQHKEKNMEKIIKNQYSENDKWKSRKQYRIWRNKQNIPEETSFRTIRQGKTPSTTFLSSLEAFSSWWKIVPAQETEIIPAIHLSPKRVCAGCSKSGRNVPCRLVWHMVTLLLSRMNSQTHLAFLFPLLLEYRYQRLQLSK